MKSLISFLTACLLCGTALADGFVPAGGGSGSGQTAAQVAQQIATNGNSVPVTMTNPANLFSASIFTLGTNLPMAYSNSFNLTITGYSAGTNSYWVTNAGTAEANGLYGHVSGLHYTNSANGGSNHLVYDPDGFSFLGPAWGITNHNYGETPFENLLYYIETSTMSFPALTTMDANAGAASAQLSGAPVLSQTNLSPGMKIARIFDYQKSYVYTVDPLNGFDATGSLDLPFKTVGAAVTFAPTNSIIFVNGGLSLEPTGVFRMKNNGSLIGLGSHKTLLDVTGAYINMDAGSNSVIQGVGFHGTIDGTNVFWNDIVTGGYNMADGFSLAGSNNIVRNLTVTSAYDCFNTSRYVGGVIEDSVFYTVWNTNNLAAGGTNGPTRCMAFSAGGDLVFRRCTFTASNGVAINAGAITTATIFQCVGGTMNIRAENCNFLYGNTNAGGAMGLTNAYGGGAISLTLVNCTVNGTNISSGFITPIIQAGRTNVNLIGATSMVIQMGTAMPSTNYVPTLTDNGAAIPGLAFTALTTTNFTTSMTALTFAGNLLWTATMMAQ